MNKTSHFFKPVYLLRGLLCLAVALSLGLGSRPAQAAPHGTIIKGPIDADTVWTVEGSPYQINIEVIVSAGVTLTIEPGVVVENSTIWQSDSYNFTIQGRLLAQGTAENPIRFLPGADGWSGISIIGTPEALNTGSVLEHVILEKGGFGAAGSGANLRLQFAEVTVRHCQFNNSPGDGILGDDGDTLGVAHVYDSSFTGNAGYAIDFQDGDVNPVLSNLTATGNGYDDGNGQPLPYGGDLVLLHNPTFKGAHTWENMGLPYLIIQATVGPDSVLTIEPGVQVLVEPGNDGLNIQGRLSADAEPGNEIRLEPADPEMGWAGLRILGSEEQPSTGTLLDHVLLPKGGFGNDCNLWVEYGDATVTNSVLSESRTSGVCLGVQGTVTLTDTQLIDNAQYAMDVRVPDNQFFLSGVIASGNLTDTIGMGGGTIYQDVVWQKSGINTFDVHGDLIIAPEASVTLEPGTTLRYEYGRGNMVHGGFFAEGTPQAPITITSVLPAPGSWGGFGFRGTPEQPATGRFAYATLEYAGYGGYGMVEIENSNVSFDHCTLQHASHGAIHVLAAAGLRSLSAGAAATQIHWSHLVDVGLFGVHNASDQPVQAAYNYWGSEDGPRGEANPGGTGSAISGPVAFQPYLVSPDAQFIYVPLLKK